MRVLFLFLFTPVAFAQEMPFSNNSRSLSVNAEFSQADADVDVMESRAGLSVPIFSTETQAWSAQVRAHSLSLSETLLIPGRRFAVPKHFGSADVGVSSYFNGAKFNQGLSASVGTSGRQIFNSKNSGNVSATYFSEWKGERGIWYFFVSYANNRSTLNNLPMPGLGYARAGKTYRYFLGLPFSMGNWSPSAWRFMGMISPFSMLAQAGYVVRGPWQISSSVAWLPRSFQNLAPDVDDERLLYDKKEWSSGVTFSPAPPISASFMYVYQFDRRFFIGSSISDRRSPAVNLADGGGAQMKVRWAF